MRVAIYARFSSDRQRMASLDDQIRLCKERIEREGWTLVQIYCDAAVSAASTLRPGYQALLGGLRNAEFDMIFVEALDRLSRDQEDIAALYKRAGFAGVRIVTLAEGEISGLHVGLKGTMNALFLKDLADKTRRGLRGRVEAGASGGGLTYGYDVVHDSEQRGGRRINKAEAVIVRRIFQAYVDGVSPKRIAHDLNEQQVAGPRDGLWAPSTINGNRARGTGILNNELYVGCLVWNRLKYSKDPDTGRGCSRLNEPDESVRVSIPELRIVDDELWQAVRTRQSKLDQTKPAEKGQHRQRSTTRRLRRFGRSNGPSHYSPACCVARSATAASQKSARPILAARRRGTRVPPHAPTS